MSQSEKSTPQHPVPSASGNLAGGGEMGALMSAFDWTELALSPIATWPQSLRTAVNICLNSQFPSVIFWGPELRLLYNDAYRSVLGDQHPIALGQPAHQVWSEIWPLIGPLLQGVVETGQGTRAADLMLPLNRNGRGSEEYYFTFSYSPIHDETGQVAGVFCSMTETTERLLAEGQLRKLQAEAEITRDQVTRILESTSDGFVTLDQAWQITYVNSVTEQFVRYHREELLGKNCWEVFPPVLGTMIEHELRRAMDERVQVRFEAYYAPFERWVEARVYPLSEGGLSVFFRDITKHKQAEAALAESEWRWRTVVEASPQLVWTCLPDGQTDYFSPQWSQYTGIAATQHQGWRWLEVVHPDDRERVHTRWLAAVEKGEEYDQEVRLRGTDGNYRWFKTRALPLRDNYGRILKWFGSCTDIEDQKRVAETLRFLSDASALLASSLDYETTLTRIARLVVPSFADACHIHILEGEDHHRVEIAAADPAKEALLHAAQRYTLAPHSETFLARVLHSGKPQVLLTVTDVDLQASSYDAEHLGILRTLKPISLLFMPLPARGRLLGAICFMTAESQRQYGPADVVLADDLARRFALAVDNALLYQQAQLAQLTLARQAVELQRSNAELRQFGYVVSHDLQEPLRTVSSFLQLLAQRYQGRFDTTADEYIALAVDGATRMQQLITDLLAYTRIGSQTREFAPVDCEILLTRTLSDLQRAIKESGAEITSDPLPTVCGDAVQLGQVLQNLIGNALKFRGPVPSRIHVSARRDGRLWILSVCDNGIGLDPQQAERIFQAFQRLHTRKEYPGTGIGLAICKKIIEQHGGRIWVESTPGHGATFFFTLNE